MECSSTSCTPFIFVFLSKPIKHLQIWSILRLINWNYFSVISRTKANHCLFVHTYKSMLLEIPYKKTVLRDAYNLTMWRWTFQTALTHNHHISYNHDAIYIASPMQPTSLYWND